MNNRIALAAQTAPPQASSARRPVWSASGEIQRQGAGVRNVVTIGTHDLPDLDPFLIFAEFGGDDPADYAGGFPDHPHRGFETATYVVEGRLRHGDSRGNEGRLGAGAFQWMTAARGLLHSEMPDQSDGPLRAFQLWINLPATHKMGEPRYQDLQAERVPAFERDGAAGRLLAGSLFGLTSPIDGGPTDPLYLDLHLTPDATITVPTPRGHTAFAYVYQGSARFGEARAAAQSITVFSPGDRIEVTADEAARLLLLAARPIREPLAKHGPFVMNTPEELQRAFADFRAGRLP
ncbi:MAG: Pirin [uncultured Sphingomonas sp.]|uniref:Pirin n=1 Tax=uncultured Sphingomonas sp. TaxID=158754 RepID=A0A6J4THK9_9SPHN|nr:pirin family protein [uncultured Sphingomonas sp.]CAA9523633.1 MAG: Pirin [uncultured Sphingomonas sp.]